jgi:hypothetical protein
MSEEHEVAAGVDRRRFLQGIGALGAAAVVSGGIARRADASPSLTLLRQPDAVGAPPADLLHLQFGADASDSVVASWSTPCGSVALGSGSVRDRAVWATRSMLMERAYTDALTGETVYTYHAPITDLRADHAYIYEVFAAGSPAVSGRFRTAPSGRVPFRFSSFGDQSIPAPVGAGKLVGPNTPNAGFIVDALEATDPLFHLLNGDLCYANVSDDPVATWRSFFGNNMRSARNRPWMPAAGNHENEAGNGTQGMEAYRNWFWLPDNGEQDDWQGNWYTFRVGNVAVVSLNNDDVCLQAGSFVPYRVANLGDKYRQDYLNGYTQGEQKAWLERTLRRFRSDARHRSWCACTRSRCRRPISTEQTSVSARNGFRCSSVGVDLVVAGHELLRALTRCTDSTASSPARPA